MEPVLKCTSVCYRQKEEHAVPHRLSGARKRLVGTKQTLKALQSGEAKVVYLAKDADERVLRPLRNALSQHDGVEVVEVESMQQLGRLCGIEVGAAAAALLNSD